jgi:hypothetical protein
MGLRKNQANLTAQEKTAFVEAVLAQKQRPSRLHPDSSDRSRYDDLLQAGGIWLPPLALGTVCCCWSSSESFKPSILP